MTETPTRPARSPLELARRAVAGLGWISVFGQRRSRLIGINALVDAAGTGIAAACLPFFLVRAAGFSTLQVALLLTVAGAAELVAAIPNGMIARRVHVRRFLIATRAISGVVWALLAFVHTLPAAIGLLVLIGMVRGGWGGLNQSFTAAALGDGKRSEMLGAVRSLRNIGYLAAGAAVAVLLSVGSRSVLVLALLVNAASFLVGAFCALLIRIEATAGPAGNGERSASVLRDWSYGLLIPPAAVYATTALILDVGLPLWMLRHHQIPRLMLGAVLILNTSVVIVLQFQVARRLDTIRRSARGIQASALALCVLAACIGATAYTPAWWTVLLLVLAALALTFAELVESPSWWTISYELAPADRKDEYLATFDMSSSTVAILGPAAMALIVQADALGWAAYALVALAAAALATRLIGVRERRAITA